MWFPFLGRSDAKPSYAVYLGIPDARGNPLVCMAAYRNAKTGLETFSWCQISQIIKGRQ
jgi:hypothetical protein